jgi:hypothetical protein
VPADEVWPCTAPGGADNQERGEARRTSLARSQPLGRGLAPHRVRYLRSIAPPPFPLRVRLLRFSRGPCGVESGSRR